MRRGESQYLGTGVPGCSHDPYTHTDILCILTTNSATFLDTRYTLPMSRRGWAYFLAMAVIWGLPYLLIRVAVRQLDPGVVVLLRTGPAALLLAPLVIARG